MAGQRPYASRLPVRFAVILKLAPLPAGMIAFSQTKALEEEIQNRGEVALIGSTIKAAAEETALISRMRGMLSSLALTLPSIVDDTQACSALMREVAELEPSASLVGFVAQDGIMACSSKGNGQDYSDYPLFDEIVAAAKPFIFAFPNGPISGTSVLGITHPVFGQDGPYSGCVVVSIAHATLREMGFSAFIKRSGFEVPVIYWTFDRNGTLLTSNLDLKVAEQRIPADLPLPSFVGLEADLFQASPVVGRTMFVGSPAQPRPAPLDAKKDKVDRRDLLYGGPLEGDGDELGSNRRQMEAVQGQGQGNVGRHHG